MKKAAKVLIVDDDKSSGEMLSEVVKRIGLSPVLATKAADALNIVKLQSVDAAIVDVLLPKMSGVDLLVEFRTTKFGDAPAILVSGVFKDRAFASEATKKAKAVDFIFKPFNADEIGKTLTKALESLFASEKWTAYSFLTKRAQSGRELARAIESLDKITEKDLLIFLLLLAVLMNEKANGNLNIVNESGEIFGLSLVNGFLMDVDTTESQATAVLSLINKGYLPQEDWDDYQRDGARRVRLENLVLEGLISPHAVAVAKREQIINDFKNILSSKTLQLNFVPEEGPPSTPRYGIPMRELVEMLGPSFDELFPPATLKDFFVPFKDARIQLCRPAEDIALDFTGTPFEVLYGFPQQVHELSMPKDIFKVYAAQEAVAQKCLMLMILNRDARFDESMADRGLITKIEHYKRLYEELKARTADKVFEYFGANERSATSAFQSIYDEYMSANDPEKVLTPESPPDLVDYCKKCQEVMKGALDIMMDDVKRNELIDKQKRKMDAQKKKSNELMTQAYEVLKKGQMAEAVKLLQDAEAIFPTSRQFLLLVWAKVKLGTLSTKPQLTEILAQMDKLSNDDKKSTFYLMALGLVKKQMGDSTAVTFFEKVLEIDSDFVEARREINAIKSKDKGDASNDLSGMMSNLFRRRSE